MTLANQSNFQNLSFTSIKKPNEIVENGDGKKKTSKKLGHKRLFSLKQGCPTLKWLSTLYLTNCP